MKYLKSAFSLLIAIVAFLSFIPAQAQENGTQQLWFSSSETENIATPLTEFNAPVANEEFTLYVIYYDDLGVGSLGAISLSFSAYWNNSILEHSDPAEVTSAGMTAQMHPQANANSVIGTPERDISPPISGTQSDGISDGDADTDYAITPSFANVFGAIFPNSPVAILRVKFRWRADATEGATSTRINLSFRGESNLNAPNQETTSIVINAPPSANAAPIADAGDNQNVGEGDTVRLDGRGSTDDDGILAYGWSSSIATLTLTNANTNTAGFTAPEVDDAGLDIILTLTVTDTAGLADSATVLIAINNVIQVSPNDFITVWNMTETNSDLIFPGYGEYTINWGDGSASEAVNNPNGNNHPSHLYATAGASTVTVSKTETQSGLTRFYLNNSSDSNLLIDVAQWGTSEWTTMESAFHGASNLAGFSAADNPNLSLVASMFFMFDKATTFNQDIGGWNVENVTNMSTLFFFASAFNQDIGSWHVENVTDMSRLFHGTRAFNQDISNWNVENVTSMRSLFSGAIAFNQDISNWNVSQVTDMFYMFSSTTAFNQNIGNWNVENVTNMSNLFHNATTFNQDISSWNVEGVTNMNSMFESADAFDQNLGLWYVVLSPASTSYEVSSSRSIATISAQNSILDNQVSAYALAGVDANQFIITNNQLSFTGDTAGSYNIDIEATDGEFGTNPPTTSRQLIITGNPPANTAPIANAGSAQSVNEGDAVRLDGTSSTDDVGIVSYGWSSDYTALTLNNSDTVVLTFTAPEVQIETEITFTLTVTDTAGVADSATVLVSVANVVQASADDFVTVWDMTNSNLNLTFPGFGQYVIDWGDGASDTVGNPDGNNHPEHNYATAGAKTVTVSRTSAQSGLTRFYLNNSSDSDLLIDVAQWGTSAWTTMESAFRGASNLAGFSATDNPNLSLIASMFSMFEGASTFNQDIGSWNVSRVTNMNSMFRNARAFNQDIGDWNVESVTSMDTMFSGASHFNQNIGNWNVSRVTNMNRMFAVATTFNQNIGNWNVENVTNMSSLFFFASAFNQDIGSWHVENVTDMSRLFRGTRAFNQDISNWNVENVTNMSNLFRSATTFNQDISSWNIEGVTNMISMFLNADAFNQNLGLWYVLLSPASTSYDVSSNRDIATISAQNAVLSTQVSTYALTGIDADKFIITDNQLSFIDDTAGTYNIKIQATDGEFGTNPPTTSYQLTITGTQLNTAPIANAGINQSVNEGAAVRLDGTGSTDNKPITLYGWTADTTITLTGADTDTAGFTAPEVEEAGLDIILTLTVTDTEGVADSATVLVRVNNVVPETAPIASAGINQSVNEGAAVILDGTGSTDNEPITLYGWTADPTITLTGANTHTAGFTAPEVEEAGLDIILTLTVTDTVGVADSATVLVRVNNVVPETAPIANAGINQSVNEGATVRLDGTGSTDNKPITLYGWTADTTITLTGADTNTAGFTAPEVEEAGLDIILTLTVTDTEGVADSATVLVRVNNVVPETAPIANAGINQSVNEGAAVRLDGTGSTDNKPIALYGWSSSVPTLILTGADTNTAGFTAPEVEEAGLDIILTLTVTDTAGLTDSATVLVRVNNVVPETEPIASAGINQSVNEGVAVILDGTGSTDNKPITLYGWSSSVATLTLTGADTHTAGFTAPEVEEAGLDIILTLTVTDTEGVADSATVLVRVNNVVPETAPIASAGINQSVNEGAAVILDGRGSTDDDAIVAYAWTADTTLTLTNADTDTASFTAPEVEEAGLDIILTLTVTNTEGVADSATVLVRVNNVPDAGTLDVDENGLFDRMDGMMILRYSFSIRGDGLTRDQTTTPSKIVEANIQNAISNPDLDIDGSGFLSPEDFIIILRYMISSRGDALTSGQTATSPKIVEDNIEALISTNP